MTGKPAGILLYESPSPTKVLVLTWFAGAVMVFCAVVAKFVFENMIDAEGSTELSPIGIRLAFAGVILSIGLSFFGGMLFYLTYYTTCLTRSKTGDLIYIETLRLFGRATRTLKPSQIDGSAYHHGQLDLIRAPSVNAPWFSVRVVRGKGFLLDMQGKIVDADLLIEVLTANGKKPIEHLEDVHRVKE
jgi:TMEM70/TMEM186/TMEM223 protein family